MIHQAVARKKANSRVSFMAVKREFLCDFWISSQRQARLAVTKRVKLIAEIFPNTQESIAKIISAFFHYRLFFMLNATCIFKRIISQSRKCESWLDHHFALIWVYLLSTHPLSKRHLNSNQRAIISSCFCSPRCLRHIQMRFRSIGDVPL